MNRRQHPAERRGRRGRASGCRGTARRLASRVQCPEHLGAASPAVRTVADAAGRGPAGRRAPRGPAPRRRRPAPAGRPRLAAGGTVRVVHAWTPAGTWACAWSPWCPRPAPSRPPGRTRRRRPGAAARRRCPARRRRRRAAPAATGVPLGVMPTPSSSTLIERLAPASSRDDRDVPAPGLALQPVPHGVLDQRLDAQERHRDRQHLGRDLQR